MITVVLALEGHLILMKYLCIQRASTKYNKALFILLMTDKKSFGVFWRKRDM